MSTKKPKMKRADKRQASSPVAHLENRMEHTIDRAAIRQAVSELPRLMVERGYIMAASAVESQPSEVDKVPATNKTEVKPVAETRYRDNAAKKTIKPAISHERVHKVSNRDPRRVWLWTGVGLTSLAIFAIWTFNLRATIQDMKIMPSPEDELLQNTRADLNAALNFTKSNDRKLEKAVQPKSAPAAETTDPGTEIKSNVQNLLQALLATSPAVPEQGETSDE